MTSRPSGVFPHTSVVPMAKQQRAQDTVAELIEAAIEALDEGGESGLRLDDIFERTGVSRSSLYHHFGDRDGLIDAARAVMFSRSVESNIRNVERVLNEATTWEEFRQGTRMVSKVSQAAEERGLRLARAYIIGASPNRPRLANELAAVQRRLTEAVARAIETAQDKGWVRPELDAGAVAVFLQAYSLGRVVSDIDEQEVDPDAWLRLVNHVVESALMVPEPD